MSEAAARVAAKLTEIWRASRGTVVERMDVLHATYASLQQDPGDAEARSRGREAAHKLSGVLGIFGLPEGSEIAAALEQALKPGEPITAEDVERMEAQIARLDALIASKPA